jgi:hypothetical protein
MTTSVIESFSYRPNLSESYYLEKKKTPLIEVTDNCKLPVWVSGRSLDGNTGSNPAGAYISVSCEFYVLSVRSLCVGPSHVKRLPTECGVSEYDLEASTVRRTWLNKGCAIEGKIKEYAKNSCTL